MPVARVRLQYRRRHSLLFDGRAVFPGFVEHLVDEGRYLFDARLVEMRRQKPVQILFNALTPDFVYGFRAGADEDLLEFFLAGILIVGDGDFRRIFGQRSERQKSFLQAMVETASDLAGPADVECLFLGVEAVGSTPAEFSAAIKSEIVSLGKVIRDAGIRAD